MDSLKPLQAELEALEAHRATLASSWYLQHCWLVQVKPGGTARTDRQYWQVRSRQPFLTGKKLKHLQAGEVEAYRAAIERGRQLQQIERQIARLQRRLEQLSESAAPALPLQQERQQRLIHQRSQQAARSIPASPVQGEKPEPATGKPAVEDLVLKSQTLRAMMRQSMAYNQSLASENSAIRQQLRNTLRRNQAGRQVRLLDRPQPLPNPTANQEA